MLDVYRMKNIFEGCGAGGGKLDQEQFLTLVQADQCKLERIVSDAHCSPDGFWYEQEQYEWVMLLSGCAELEIERAGRVVVEHLQVGDMLTLPAGCRHRVKSTSTEEKTVWLALYYCAG